MINQGISFGLLPGLPNWIFIILLLALGIYAVKMRELWGRVGLTLIIVGGVGNLVSRYVSGGVVDNWQFFGLFYNNIWDWIIATGVIVFVISTHKAWPRRHY